MIHLHLEMTSEVSNVLFQLQQSEHVDGFLVNLGKWILRSLFAKLIEQESVQDVNVRHQVTAKANQSRGISRPQAPISIQLPKASSRTAYASEQDDTVTSRVTNAAPVTPGSAIVAATPQLSETTATSPNPQITNGDVRTNGGRTSLERRSEENTEASNRKVTSDEQGDASQNENATDGVPATSPNESKEEKTGTSLFGKKFRMTFPKKLGRSSAEVKTAVVDERSEDPEQTNLREEKSNGQYLQGTLDDIRAEYEGQMLGYSSFELESAIVPSINADNPPLHPPASTTIIIQEDSSDLGAVVDRYRGSVGSVGQDTGLIKQCAPRWLGDLLLRVRKVRAELGRLL